MWLASFAYEHVADHQKLIFIMECKKKNVRDAVCDVGLWRYREVQQDKHRIHTLKISCISVPNFVMTSFSLYTADTRTTSESGWSGTR